MYMQEDHVRWKPRPPLGAWPMHLYGSVYGMPPCPEILRTNCYMEQEVQDLELKILHVMC